MLVHWGAAESGDPDQRDESYQLSIPGRNPALAAVGQLDLMPVAAVFENPEFRSRVQRIFEARLVAFAVALTGDDLLRDDNSGHLA